jgi:N-acetylglucosaminyl-diphospho-decaprenol L-rhamnosyltransferase
MNGAPTPAVAAVIVSYNTRALLLECLDSLRAVTAPLEIVVVDNASADGSADAVRERHPGVGVVANPDNVGFSKANNLGIRATRAPYVLVLNSDAAVRPGAVETLVSILEARAEVGIVGPRTVSADGTIQVSFGLDLTLLNEWRQRGLVHGVKRREAEALRRAEALAAVEHEPAWVSGSCFLARRRVLDALGGFDEGFFLYEEDVDLCVRIRQAGHKVLYTPQAEIVHHLGQSMESASARARLEYRRSHLRFYRKHNGPLSTALLRVWMALGRG